LKNWNYYEKSIAFAPRAEQKIKELEEKLREKPAFAPPSLKFRRASKASTAREKNRNHKKLTQKGFLF
jgi:hypothetical protein